MTAMDGAPRKSREMKVAPWVAATDEEARASLHNRVALFSVLVFWATASLLAFVSAMYWVYPETEPARADIVQVSGVVGLITLGMIWWIGLRGSKTDIGTLYGIDMAVTIVAGTILGLSMGLSPEKRANVWV